MNRFQRAASITVDTICVIKSVMRSVSSMEAKRIPLGQKVAFGVGMLANQMFPAALGIFMVILVQSLGMSPFCGASFSFCPNWWTGDRPDHGIHL